MAYAGALFIVAIALFITGVKKEHMLLNINKTAQLYRFTRDGKIVNDYTFLFQNTDSKDHTFYFEIVDNPKIKIIRPVRPFKLQARKKIKKIVQLEAVEPLAKNIRKDTPIPVVVKAYATDDPDKIHIERKTVFVYPRWDIVQKRVKTE